MYRVIKRDGKIVDFDIARISAAIVKAFKDNKRDPSGAFQLSSYAAAQALIESIKAVGDNPAKVADHLHKSNIDTAIGNIGWDKKGDLKSFDFQVFQWHKNGSKSIAAK